MVFLKTDTGEFRELLVPSIISVGRGTDNDIRPESRSVSKQHAQITITQIPGTGKVEAWLEDLNSMYGTFAGETPLEIERVQGKVKLYFGFYMRFGHAPNYFRYMETLPRDAEVMRPEIKVSPSKAFQQQVQAFSVQQAQSEQAPPPMGGFQMPTPDRNNNTNTVLQPSRQPISPEEKKADLFQQSNNFASGGGGSGKFESSREFESHNFDDHSRSRSRPSSGRRASRSSLDAQYDSNDEDGPRNMQISVSYPTGGKHSPSHPVSIIIDPAGGNGSGGEHSGNERARRSQGSRPQSGRSAGDRYSSHSPERNVSFSDEFNFNNYNDTLNKAVSLGMGQSLGMGGGGMGQDGISGPAWSAQHGGTDNVEFEESYNPNPAPQFYNRSNVIQAQYPGAGAHAFAQRPLAVPEMPAPSPSAVGKPAAKPKSVFDSIHDLNNLAKKSVGMNSSKLGKPSGSMEENAMHSRYYQQARTSLSNSGTQPKGILKPPKQVDFRARMGDNGAIMDAVLPSKATLVRRSWPEELLSPTSELISNFVDLLLAQETGTTHREFALYRDIYFGKSKDKNPSIKIAPGEDLLKVPVLFNLKMNPIKCELPIVLPDTVMSEAVAETILDIESTATGLLGATISELNNLMRQCLLGTRIDGMPEHETSADFDHALQGVVTSIIKHAIAQLMCAQQSNVVRALEGVKNLDIRSNAGLLIQQAIDSLTRTNSFMNGTYLQEESMLLKPANSYEIVAFALSAILNKLDACNVSIWSIGQRADEVTMEHVVNKSGGFLKASLTLELDELRKLKKESDLTPLVDRIRQQETNILERKLIRFHKVFEIILGFNLKAAFWEWRNNARSLKRHELALMDLSDRCATNKKREYMKVWIVNFRKTHQFKKTLKRFGRIVSLKGHNQMRKYIQRWASLVDRSKLYSESGVEIARLRNQLCNLKATLHDLTNQDEAAASLAAERALNRELSAMNLELRHSMQMMEEKLLEVGGAPSGKRKDLVFHYLTGKEEELAEARRENKFLHSELDHLRVLAARRLQPPPRSRALVAPAAVGRAAPAKLVNILRAPNDLPASNGRGGVGGAGAAGNPPARSTNSAAPSSQARYDPSRNKSVNDRPGDIAFMMSKDEAKIVILSEVRRLRESHAMLQESRNQLNNKMIEETTRNVQLTMAAQSLQGRLTAMERSANALRELLKQKFGDQGVVHMMEALENLGAGANALLEVPVSGSVNVASELFTPGAAVQAGGASGGAGAQSPSYESKRPDSAPPVSGYNRGGPGAVPQGAYADSTASYTQQGAKVSPRGYGPSSRPLAGRTSTLQAPPQEDYDPTQVYSKAIEGALYR